MKMKVIHPNNAHTRLPFTLTGLCLLAMDFYDAAQWLWGVVSTVLIIYWILILIALYKEERVNIFTDDSSKKSKFEERVKEAIKEQEKLERK